MANSIRITTGQWADIRRQIREEYPTRDSVLIIRSVGQYDGYGNYQESIYLDFVDDAKETFFRLKYL